jgi:hypothetical protein
MGVPGFVHGLYTAYTQHGSGRLSWARLLQPTIDYLRRGVPISPAVAEALRSVNASLFDVGGALRYVRFIYFLLLYNFSTAFTLIPKRIAHSTLVKS